MELEGISARPEADLDLQKDSSGRLRTAAATAYATSEPKRRRVEQTLEPGGDVPAGPAGVETERVFGDGYDGVKVTSAVVPLLGGDKDDESPERADTAPDDAMCVETLSAPAGESRPARCEPEPQARR